MMDTTPQLTSTTAPGKVFASRGDLAAHYKSDYHKYNLKRREGGLPYLLETDFNARLEAAKAMRQEKLVGTDHLKTGVKRNDKKEKKQKGAAVGGAVQVSQAAAFQRVKYQQDEDEEKAEAVSTDPSTVNEDVAADADTDMEPTPEQAIAEEAIVIEPRQCLFDKHFSESVEANCDRMLRKYGFFVPDREYLTDLEGLIGYCHEKVKLGHMCLYCQKIFTTWQGCQKHMVSKSHCKIRYEPRVDLEDFSVFYDFSEADAAFMASKNAMEKEGDGMAVVDETDEVETEGIEEWEDISDDEMEVDEEEKVGADDEYDEDEAGLYDDYQDEMARMGFDVTPLGELIFPDGRIVGHRLLRRYYKQRPTTTDSTAVVAAKSAAGERVYRGQVYNVNNAMTQENSLALQRAGLNPGLAAGRAGKGLLVPIGPGGSFSQLSVYRYRAAVRKQRIEHAQGKRQLNRTRLNMNQMDKKANRLFNNVSVAHAKR
jgi:pre-60S factor REI1